MLKRILQDRFLNIQWKLVLPLAVTILGMLLVAFPLMDYFIASRIEQDADRRLAEIADSVSELIADSEYAARNSAILLAQQPFVQQSFFQLSSLSQTLLEQRDMLGLQELSLYQADQAPGEAAFFYGGPAVIRRLQASEEAERIRAGLITWVLETGAPTSGIAISPQNSQIIGVAPVYDSSRGALVGVVLAAFYLDEEYLDNISLILDTDLAIVKDNATIVANIDPATGFEQLGSSEWLTAAELPAANVRYGSGVEYRLLAHPLVISDSPQGTLFVAQPVEELFRINRTIRVSLTIILAIFSLTALWFWLASLLTFTRPLANLTAATTRISQGEFDQKVETRYLLLRDEITVLSENFNAMAAHLSELYASLEARVAERTRELEQALAELEQARDSAVAANRSKSEFVSFVSHEMKIPMTSIKGYSDLMLAGATGPLNDNQTGFLNTIRSNVNRMATLVSDLADISRIESGNLRLEPAAVDAGEVIGEVLAQARNQIEHKQQALDLSLGDGLPRVWCDRNRLAQILVNLVSNANKYTPDGGQITIEAIAQPGAVRFMVRDTGAGISGEDQEKLFTKFFRSADDQVRAAPGTGLGLSITRHLVELQGGKIWFKSEFRKGTSFFFTLPAAPEGA